MSWQQLLTLSKDNKLLHFGVLHHMVPCGIESLFHLPSRSTCTPWLFEPYLPSLLWIDRFSAQFDLFSPCQVSSGGLTFPSVLEQNVLWSSLASWKRHLSKRLFMFVSLLPYSPPKAHICLLQYPSATFTEDCLAYNSIFASQAFSSFAEHLILQDHLQDTRIF